MKKIFILPVLIIFLTAAALRAEVIETKAVEINPAETLKSEYRVGVDDILDINIIKPDQITTQCTVAPDGSISFPYIGNVRVEGMTLNGVQDALQRKLSEGYLKYPVVSVSLKESRSRKFFVYGEVVRPGSYALEDNMTALKAVSLAGGFTKYASSSGVKVLRFYKDKEGYEPIKVSINAVMNGDSKKDIVIQPGDIIVISEGIF